MRRPYTIRTAAAFVLDGVRLFGGERIMLEDDVAKAHADKLDLIDIEAEAAARAAAAEQPADGQSDA